MAYKSKVEQGFDLKLAQAIEFRDFQEIEALFIALGTSYMLAESGTEVGRDDETIVIEARLLPQMRISSSYLEDRTRIDRPMFEVVKSLP